MKNYPQILSLKYLEAASYIWNAKTERNFIIRIGMAINAFFNGRKISYIDAENFKIGRNKNTYAYNPISSFLITV